MIIGLSGKIGSGKTTIGRALAKELNFRYASFGDYVRHLLRAQGGDPDCREQLQDLGASLVRRDHLEFCKGFLSFASYEDGNDLVIDGIRHVKILNAIRELLPTSKILLLYLETSEISRHERLERRDEDVRRIVRAQQHRVEHDLETELPKRADAIIDSSLTIEEAVRSCMAFISAASAQSSR